jgi:hypothetical protein
MSSVQYIPRALATTLGVLSPRGHDGCTPRRQSQARSGGNRTLGLKSMAQVHKSTPIALQARSCGNCTLGLKSMARVLKLTPVVQVDANSRTQAHSGGTSRLQLQS